MNKTNKAEADTAKAVRYEAGLIAERFFSATCQHHEWEQASEVLNYCVENIATPTSLRELADLLIEVAEEGERLATDSEHEAETTEALCRFVAESLMAKYDKFVGRG